VGFGIEKPGEIPSPKDKSAVGEIENSSHAIDKGQAHGHDRIKSPQYDSADDGINDRG
jgi:hypothetical protein